MLQIVIDNLEALKLDYSRFSVQKNYFNSEMISITLICSLPNKIGELTIWNDLSSNCIFHPVGQKYQNLNQAVWIPFSAK